MANARKRTLSSDNYKGLRLVQKGRVEKSKNSIAANDTLKSILKEVQALNTGNLKADGGKLFVGLAQFIVTSLLEVSDTI